MKNYTITVNGNVYAVVVEEGSAVVMSKLFGDIIRKLLH